jgi:hypothetical protein
LLDAGRASAKRFGKVPVVRLEISSFTQESRERGRERGAERGGGGSRSERERGGG